MPHALTLVGSIIIFFGILIIAIGIYYVVHYLNNIKNPNTKATNVPTTAQDAVTYTFTGWYIIIGGLIVAGIGAILVALGVSAPEDEENEVKTTKTLKSKIAKKPVTTISTTKTT